MLLIPARFKSFIAWLDNDISKKAVITDPPALHFHQWLKTGSCSF
jgi:hypothetical protein